jgi:hypothetical protein
MTTLRDFGIEQLEKALAIRKQIESLKYEMAKILDSSLPLPEQMKGKMSAAARARIGAAQKLRWAKLKGVGSVIKAKRSMSAKTRAAMAAAARERWKKAKAAGKSTL